MNKRLASVTQEQLAAMVKYDHATGILTWKVQKPGRARMGAECGGVDDHGYRRMSVCGVLVRTHQVIWLLTYGEWPPSEIDHINFDKLDNRLSNLRLATREQNLSNRKKLRTNTSGHKGVFWNRRERKWSAVIKSNKRRYHLGWFKDLEKAAAAYREAAAKYHGEFACVD